MLDKGNPASAQIPEAIASPFRRFTRDEWAKLRADTPLTLSAEDLRKLQSLHDPISLEEVIAIYLPLSRLLALYVAATQGLFKATQRFLGADDGKVPYIIGIAGSVAVGKSTTARVLQAMLSRWPNTPKVQLVTTDGFLHPNATLEREGLMERKGFPESYDGSALIRFLSEIKAGKRNVVAPVYSHLVYDVVPGDTIAVDRPDILIVEGLNVLLPNRLSRTPTRRCSRNGTSRGSCACARRRSATRAAISTNTPTSATMRRARSPVRSGHASTSSICARTSCRPGRAQACC
jgi:type I pantothenate kinase